MTGEPIPQKPAAVFKGRGATTNPPNRFERLHVEPDPDADLGVEETISPKTQFFMDSSQSILTENESPDIPYTIGLNAYRGCEHGCTYCYARPFHEYLGWSSGLDFETKILVKLRAPQLLRDALSDPKWMPQTVTMSGVTDCYQPCEKHFKLTRQCLEVFREFRNPVSLVTKNFLVTRDLDLLSDLARQACTSVYITITTLDPSLASAMEPRAARPEARLRAIRMLADAGVPVGVNVAPVIPGLTDHEMPAILDAAAAAGARRAGYIALRLPHAVKEVFSEWLSVHAPTKKARVLDRVRELRGGKLNVSEFGARMKGEGIFAEQIHDLFALAARKTGLDRGRIDLSASGFRRPGGVQMELL